MMRYKIQSCAIIIWFSFFSLLTFYILQKGQGLDGMEYPFFNTGNRGDQYVSDIYHNLISFGFVMLCFIFIWLTKKNKEVCWYSDELVENVFVFILLVLWLAKGVYTAPSLYLNDITPASKIGKLILFLSLAVLSIPCIFFIISWLREKSTGICREKINQWLKGICFFRCCVGFAILCIGISVFYAFSLDCRSDEGVSLLFISHSYTDLIASTAVDVHPPLYYCIAKFIVDCIQTCFPSLHIIYAAKLVSVIPAAVLSVICLTVVRREWGNYVGGIGSIVVLCMPGILNHTQEIRMYSWGMLWMTCCWLWGYKVYRYNRLIDWLILSIFGVLVAYTQYIVCIGVAILYCGLAIWCREKRCFGRWCMLVLISVTACIPWLLILMHYRTQSIPYTPNWMGTLDRFEICHLILFPTKDILVCGVLGGIASVSLLYLRKNKTGITGLLGLTLPTLFIVIAVIITNTIVPVLAPRMRYLIPFVGCMWLGSVLLVDKLRLVNLRILFTAIVLFIGVSECISFAHVQQRGRDDAYKLAEFLDANDVVIISYKDIYGNISVALHANRPVYIIGHISQFYFHRYESLGIGEMSLAELNNRVKVSDNFYFIPHLDGELSEFMDLLCDTDMELAYFGDYSVMGGGRTIKVYQLKSK